MGRRHSNAVVACALAWVAGCGDDASAGGDSSSGTGSSDTTTHVGSADASSIASDSDSADATGASNTTGASADATSSEESSDTGAVFVHEFSTLLTDDGRLALASNLPRNLDECLALPGDPPCTDDDDDGLTDAWEDVALDRLRPLRRMDEAEQAVGNPSAVLADVGRVFAVGRNVRLLVMLGYSHDYGSCGITAHDGDSERVALDLEPYEDGGAGGVVMAQAYTAAHENTVNDHSQLFATDELSQFVFALDPATSEPRWVVFPSADKHATYATIAICEAISVVPCIDEDCGPDGVADPSAYDLLPLAFNAGEPEAPRLTDLTRAGFPGDDAWAEQDFCGGQGGTMCSASVREKLTVDPF